MSEDSKSDGSVPVTLARRQENAEPVLLIDGRPTEYGQFSDGTFYLKDDAYRWSRDLLELGREHRLYRQRAAALRASRREGIDGNS